MQQELYVGSHNDIYATKKMNNTRKNIKMPNIFIISHLFDDIWLRCLKRELRAPSTFASDSSMLSSILLITIRDGQMLQDLKFEI